jgi:putative ABC transport system substrate-binding protein
VDGVGLDIVGKELEEETVPKVHRMAVLSNPANPGNVLALRNVKSTARSLGVQRLFLEARGPNEFEGAFAAMARERVGAFLVVPDAVFGLHRAQLRSLRPRAASRQCTA